MDEPIKLFEMLGCVPPPEEPELEAGQRRETNVGPATVVRVCESEVHLRADRYPSLMLVTTLDQAAEYPLVSEEGEGKEGDGRSSP
jgi:hypothetical protein